MMSDVSRLCRDAEKRAQEAERQAAESNLRVTELTAEVDLLREKLERCDRRVSELEPALAAANAQLATLQPPQTEEKDVWRSLENRSHSGGSVIRCPSRCSLFSHEVDRTSTALYNEATRMCRRAEASRPRSWRRPARLRRARADTRAASRAAAA